MDLKKRKIVTMLGAGKLKSFGYGNEQDRFGFGENWQDFLRSLDQGRIGRAEDYLRSMTGLADFKGKTFLDIGSGSGLFSLAARRLDAKVMSFDYDENSVAATRTLKEKYFPGDGKWDIGRGDVLDEEYMRSLGRHDIVYSWGVLHHTGNMHGAFDNAAAAVNPGGFLYIAIYNDEGIYSAAWRRIKKLYNRIPPALRPAYVWIFTALLEGKSMLGKILRFKNPAPQWEKRNRESLRGMSVWHDYVDWVGGYPFEVARPDEIFRYFRDRGFSLQNLLTVGRGHGCNEYLFLKDKEAEDSAGAISRIRASNI